MSVLKELSEALKKSAETPFYSSVIVVSPDRAHMLLAKRKDGQGWTMPAGGAEANETPEVTAIRETFEESNVFLFPDQLEKLLESPCKNGKICHVYMAILENWPDHGAQNDPDKEVRKWKWHPISEPLPEPMSEARRGSAAMAIFTLAKKKAEQAFFDAMEEFEIQHVEKSMSKPVGSMSSSGKYKKVAEGDWRQIGGHGDTSSKKQGMDKTPSQKPMHSVDVKFKHNGKEYTHQFKVGAQSPDHAWGQVEGQLKELESKIGPIQMQSKSIKPLEKSLAENEMTGTNIDTTHQATEELATKDSIWLARIKERFADMGLAAQPRMMDLDFPWELQAIQVDNGIYDGHVKNKDTLSAESGDVVFQIKKMTLPAMVEALRAKEYIKEPDAPVPPPEEKVDAHGIKELVEALKDAAMTPNVVNINFYKGWSDPEKLEFLLEKARPALPVGTRKTWGNQDYVKHSDGWVAVSGDHHGKLLGKFKEKPTHKEHADEHSPKSVAPKEESKELSSTILDGKYTIKPQVDKEKKTFNSKVFDADGKQIGNFGFAPDSNGKLSASSAFVEPQHRRAGIASEMYNQAEVALGEKLQPSDNQTDDAKKLWESRDYKAKPKDNSEETSRPEGMKTESIDRLFVKFRGKGAVDGKPSDLPYKSPKGSTCNLVGYVAFGKAPKKTQKELNQRLQEAETILSSIGFKFKTPIDFVAQNVASGKQTLATYINKLGPQDNPRINISGKSNALSKSLMHEIGHAVDYSLHAGSAGSRTRMGEQLSDKAEPSELKGKFTELRDIVVNSAFYTDKETSPKYQEYITDPTEIFARAFEVYAYEKGLELVKKGKIDKGFVEGYLPDVYKTRNEKLTEVRKQVKDVEKEQSSLESEYAAKRTKLRKQAEEELGLGKKDSFGFTSFVPGDYEKIGAKVNELVAKDKDFMDLAEKRSQLTKQRYELMAQVVDLKKEGDNGWLSVPQELRKDYSKKIVTLMDDIFAKDEVKKAITSLTLNDLNETLKGLL